MILRFFAAVGLVLLTASWGLAGEQAKLVMLGDSVTLSADAPEGKKLRDCTEKALNALSKGRPGWTVVNKGVGGETSEGGLGRIAGVLAAEKPDFLSIAYGLNDARHHSGDWFKGKYTALVDAAGKAQPPPRLVLVTATPFLNDKHAWGKEPFFVKAGGLDRFLDRDLNGVTRTLAAERGLPLCDIHRQFLAEPKYAQFIKGDGVHLVPEGNEFAGARIAACVQAVWLAGVARDAAALDAETKARAKAAAARKALEAAGGQPTAEAVTALGEAAALCPYLAETAVLLDKVAAAQERK